MKLIVTYKLHGSLKSTEADEIFRVRDGFWVDAFGKICYTNEAKIYIMPHMIKEIRKEEEAKFEKKIDKSHVEYLKTIPDMF